MAWPIIGMRHLKCYQRVYGAAARASLYAGGWNGGLVAAPAAFN